MAQILYGKQGIPALNYFDIFAISPPFFLEREPEGEACVGKHGGFLFLFPDYLCLELLVE
ncbi:MAG: hypothetical protein ACOCXH_12680 [Cyclobacteriaceae bacterium]